MRRVKTARLCFIFGRDQRDSGSPLPLLPADKILLPLFGFPDAVRIEEID
jgi:hypothetical protein